MGQVSALLASLQEEEMEPESCRFIRLLRVSWDCGFSVKGLSFKFRVVSGCRVGESGF